MNQQLRLFALPKPLAERFGADFFQGLPKPPGVYRIGPRRNHEIQSKFGLSQPLIRQEELDNWIVRDRLTLGPPLAALKISSASLTPASRPDLRSRSDLLADSKSSSHSSASVTRA